MKAAKTLIAWNPIADRATIKIKGHAPPGSIAVGPLQTYDELDWTRPYYATGGAANVDRRKLKGIEQDHRVMLDWYVMVYSYGIHPYLAHRAFLLIDEYRKIITLHGWGPAKGELGHDPDTPFGRAIIVPPPKLHITKTGKATHFWPTEEA